MKRLNRKDNRNRFLYKKFEEKRNYLKTILKNSFLNEELKIKTRIKLNKLPRSSSIVKIHNRCIITGRSRGIYKDFKLSRIMLKTLILNGFLPGITKSSW